jgi:hypothetical protein
VVISGLGSRKRPPARRSIGQLHRAVDQALRWGPIRPRCLVRAAVLFDLLRAQGDGAELVIGLDTEPTSKDAHAWVELDGVDVGPPPGRGDHTELVRYP